MGVHVLGKLDKQWKWWQMVRHVGSSMDRNDQCCTAAKQNSENLEPGDTRTLLIRYIIQSETTYKEGLVFL